MEYHKFCPESKGRILTIEQMRENKPCDWCQKKQNKNTGVADWPNPEQEVKLQNNGY
jgi:hypothetical protein